MPVSTLHDLQQRRQEPSAGYSLHRAPDDYVPGNGLLDRYTFIESWPGWFRRHLRSRLFWFRLAAYLALQYGAIQVEFGQPFFVVSLVYFIYISMGREDRNGVRSAYSVFNKGPHRTLHGDLTAKELDRQLRGELLPAASNVRIL
ncbi:hypothetical protein HDV03_000752 [Kappamyces sp. JEL0829]|nr:hypothetical protein HDV03_000752 [Kappamyces sp. JEL0829]KAJ3356890.1 hypothetical protein HDU91_005499 [Kappamyces sp. JEL0680]